MSPDLSLETKPFRAFLHAPLLSQPWVLSLQLPWGSPTQAPEMLLSPVIRVLPLPEQWGLWECARAGEQGHVPFQGCGLVVGLAVPGSGLDSMISES